MYLFLLIIMIVKYINRENFFNLSQSSLLCSWLGMLPGTWAYVSAGAFGRAIIVS